LQGANLDEKEFQASLKKSRRSQNTIVTIVRHIKDFEKYLSEERAGKILDDIDFEDLNAFVDWIEREPKVSAKKHLWALRYYFEHIANEDLRLMADVLREQRIERTGFEGIATLPAEARFTIQKARELPKIVEYV
jgi:site-specific recombinase XerD